MTREGSPASERSSAMCFGSIEIGSRQDSGFAGLVLARAPGPKSLLHVRVREQRVAQFAQYRTVHDASHVRTPRDFPRGNMNLQDEAVGILDRRSKNHAVEPGPQSIGHAHGARPATGVYRKTG